MATNKSQLMLLGKELMLDVTTVGHWHTLLGGAHTYDVRFHTSHLQASLVLTTNVLWCYLEY